MARPPSANSVLKNIKKQQVQKKTPIATDMFLPNYSVVKGAGNLGNPGSVLFLGANGQIAEDNSNLFWDDANKHLGIGKIPVGVVLDMQTDLSSRAYAIIENTRTTTGGDAGYGIKAGTGNYNYIWTDTNENAFRFYINFVDRMIIDGSGKVGIGTTSPGSTLHINDGTTTDQLRIMHGEVFGYKIGRNTGTGLLEFRGTQAGFTGYVFRNDDGSADLSILDSGNVGIGTLNPLLKLDVRGRIKAVATTTGTPPFVAYATDGTTVNALLGSWDSDNSALNLKDSSQANKVLLSSKANAVSYINNGGNVGIGTATPTQPLSVKEKSGMSAIGGFCIKLTNKTGGNTVQGQLVAVYSATAVNDAFKVAALNDDGVFGIVLEAGVADASEAWVVVSGIADVLIDAGGSAIGDRMISSGNTAGSADVWNTGGAVATHFLEIGHCIETRAGAGLARCVLHFN